MEWAAGERGGGEEMEMNERGRGSVCDPLPSARARGRRRPTHFAASLPPLTFLPARLLHLGPAVSSDCAGEAGEEGAGGPGRVRVGLREAEEREGTRQESELDVAEEKGTCTAKHCVGRGVPGRLCAGPNPVRPGPTHRLPADSARIGVDGGVRTSGPRFLFALDRKPAPLHFPPRDASPPPRTAPPIPSPCPLPGPSAPPVHGRPGCRRPPRRSGPSRPPDVGKGRP